MRVLRAPLAGLALALVGLALVPQAAAEIDGPCTGTIAGQDLATASPSDASKAIVVEPDEVVSYSFSAPAGVTGHEATARIGPYELKLGESAADGETASAAGTFDVGQVSGIAVGLYSVTAHATLADGQSCTGTFLLRIEGGALDSAAGMTAAAAAVLAGGGVVAVSVTTATGVKGILATLKLVA